MSGMMVSSLMGVECSTKIAMSALRGGAAAMALLRDRDRPRCIFVGFRAREFVNQDSSRSKRFLSFVMPGLVPGIHVLASK
jgi:hypothetical protein